MVEIIKFYEGDYDPEEEYVLYKIIEDGNVKYEYYKKINSTSSVNHTHTNLSLLESITEKRMQLWDSKSGGDCSSCSCLDLEPIWTGEITLADLRDGNNVITLSEDINNFKNLNIFMDIYGLKIKLMDFFKNKCTIKTYSFHLTLTGIEVILLEANFEIRNNTNILIKYNVLVKCDDDDLSTEGNDSYINDIKILEIQAERVTTSENINVEGFFITQNTLELIAEDTAYLDYSITPSNATNRTVIWSSSDDSIATVNSVGKVTAVSEGNVSITGKTEDGNFSDICAVTVAARIRVTGVNVSPSTLTINTIGETYTLVCNVLPSNATNKNVTWSTNNSTIATVSADGIVKAIKNGTAIITATTEDGSYRGTCNITVDSSSGTNVNVTGITVNPSTYTINTIGETYALTYNISPSNATNKNVSWSSATPSVATVNSSGVVTAVSNGTSTITATTEDGNYSSSCRITVSASSSEENVSVTGVTVAPNSITMTTIGETYNLNYTISPTNASNKNVTWKSNNESIATVTSSGVVKAIANGATIITVTTEDGNYSATCAVTVSEIQEGDTTLYTPDIASYGISNDGTNSTDTTNGLNTMFADLRAKGKLNIQMPTGTYAIDPEITVSFPSDTTIDLNAATFKIDTNDKNGSKMFTMKDISNTTVKNGTIEGDRYTHDYSTYDQNTTSHEFNVGLRVEQNTNNVTIENITFKNITGYGMYTTQGTGYELTALDKTLLESGTFDENGNAIDDDTKIRYPNQVSLTKFVDLGYFQVGTYLNYQNYLFNSTRQVTALIFDASNNLLTSATTNLYRPIAIPTDASYCYLTFPQADPTDILDGDLYKLDVFHMKPPKDFTIKNCTFDDCRCLGIAMCGGWNVTIEGNDFKNISKPSTDTTSPNYQFGRPGYAIDIEDGWEGTQDLYIKNNTFSNNGFGDIVAMAGDNIQLTNNQFNGRVAFYSRATNYKILSNTFIDATASFETEKDYGFTVAGNTYTNTLIKGKYYKKPETNYTTFEDETITNGEMQLDTSLILKNSTITLDGVTGSRFTGNYDGCTISNVDASDANSDYSTGIVFNNCNVSKANLFPTKETIMTGNTFDTFRVRLDSGSLVFTGNTIKTNPKNTAKPIVELVGGDSATIKNNILESAVTVSLYTNVNSIPLDTDSE